MGLDAAIEYADQLLYERTGKHLNDLQSHILQQSWKGRTYRQVASLAGYSEGHVKDVASQLWKLLSEALGERITKGNLRTRLLRRLKRTIKQAAPLAFSQGSAHASKAEKENVIAAVPIAATATNPAFLGRDPALQTLETLSMHRRILVIQGEGGIGKTTLAQHFIQRFDITLELLMAKETVNIIPAESVAEEWLRQTFDEEPGQEYGVTLSRLKTCLQGKSVGIVVDNLEPALDGNGQFIQAYRSYVELLRMLATSTATTLITSRDRLCEPSVAVHHYRLPGLALSAWSQYMQQYGIATDDSLTKIHHAYGGNAKAMEILAAIALEDFDGDLATYWQQHRRNLLSSADLRNLVGSQVDRLRQLDPDAYQLFCRLGCYRYQDQPTLTVDAICAQMPMASGSQQQQIIMSLRDRSLLECRKGRYWLHPVSRAEAVNRLRASNDWIQANQLAATYWQASVTSITSISDAHQALEAYYHLIAIEEFARAASILLQSRHNQWQQHLPLASSLYRMGLLQPALHTIKQVLPHVQVQQASRSELNNILGDVYWITGHIQSAIDCQRQTIASTDQLLMALASASTRDRYYLKMLNVDAHLSIGLYCIDLWELDQAAEQFAQVIQLAQGTAHQAWADKATIGLALVRSHQQQSDEALTLTCQAYQRFVDCAENVNQGRHAYFLQLLSHALLQVGETEKAEELLKRAIALAETGHCIQVKAKALIGLAILHRQRGELTAAFNVHHQAIELCQDIGAVCDLAEATLQLGLSQRQAASAEDLDIQGRFETAEALFTEIQAPQQVNRVAALTAA